MFAAWLLASRPIMSSSSEWSSSHAAIFVCLFEELSASTRARGSSESSSIVALSAPNPSFSSIFLSLSHAIAGPLSRFSSPRSTFPTMQADRLPRLPSRRTMASWTSSSATPVSFASAMYLFCLCFAPAHCLD